MSLLSLPLWSPSHRLLPAVTWRAAPSHRATYLLLLSPPYTPPRLLFFFFMVLFLLNSKKRKKRKPSAWQIIPSFELVCECVCVSLPLSYLCHPPSFSLSVAWADRGAVSRCLCQRKQRGRETSSAVLLFLSLPSFLFCILSSFSCRRSFPGRSLSTPASLNRSKILCLWLSISLSLTRANTRFSQLRILITTYIYIYI